MATDKSPFDGGAQVWVHGSVATSWEQVAGFLTGDAHDRSKVSVLVRETDGRFSFLQLFIQEKT